MSKIRSGQVHAQISFYSVKSYVTEESLAVQLRLCLDKITDAVDAALKDTGLNAQLFGALHAILQGSARNPSELAQLRYQNRAAITYTLNVLEKKSLIRRIINTSDRRMIELKLTPKGEALTRACLPLIVEAQNHALSPLTTEEYMSLQRSLRKLAEQQTVVPRPATNIAADGPEYTHRAKISP